MLLSSAASRLGSPGEYVDYAASKGAVDTLGLGLAREVSGEGIRVNVVRPGIIETDIHASGGQPDRAARLGPTRADRPGGPGRGDRRRGGVAAQRRGVVLHGQRARRGGRPVGGPRAGR